MPTHHKGPAREVRALDAFIKVSRALETLGAELQHVLTEDKVTHGQFGVLEALFHLGPMNQTALGEKLLRSGANVCTVIDNLEKRGLVRRERSADDRREVFVALTPEGQSLIERLFPTFAARLTELMGALSTDEQEQLAHLARKLGKGIRGVSSPP